MHIVHIIACDGVMDMHIVHINTCDGVHIVHYIITCN